VALNIIGGEFDAERQAVHGKNGAEHYRNTVQAKHLLE